MTDQATTTETKTDKPNIFSIPKWNIERLETAMEKLNKKARKWDLPELTYTILKEFLIDAPSAANSMLLREKRPQIEMVEIEIKGEGPVIAGWKFLGVFDHVTLPGSVIVNTVPGEVIPPQFHNCEPICDHCGTKRRRNETFLMQEVATGDYKLVGRQCVRDFIGYDAKEVFSFLKWVHKLEKELDEDDVWMSGGGRHHEMFAAENVLAVTASIIAKYGWVSKSKADWDQTPTSGEVMYFYYPPVNNAKELEAWKKWKAELNIEDPKWTETAKAAREWLKEQTGDSEYMHNLHTIDENVNNAVPTRLFGYWCSLVATYQRAMDTLREQAKKKRVNEHVGEIKKRREFKVTLDKLRTFESQWGYVYLHTFLDEEGHTLVWFASSEQDFDYEKEYTIKATVKKHDDYKGWAQTAVTRVAEVK